jgi:hypothetical protein
MKQLLLCTLALPLFAGQALVTEAGKIGTATLPDAWPYTSLTDTRLEVRLTNVQPCQAVPTDYPNGNSSYVTNWFQIRATNGSLFSLGCSNRGAWGVQETAGSAGSPVTYLTSAEAAGKTDLIVRMQKDQTNQRYSVEFWTPDGTRIKEHINTSSAVHKSQAAARTIQNTLIRGGGTVQIAWMRWYSNVVPLNSTMPSNSGPAGDLANWEFEGDTKGTRTDASGQKHALNIVYSAPLFAPAPVYAPHMQASVTNALAGGTMILDASESFTWDDSPFGDFEWQWLEGPAKPLIHSPKSPRTEVTRIVEGQHTFQYTVGGVTNRLAVTVENRDLDGWPIYPSNDLSGHVWVQFRLADVPGAADVQMTIKKPDGRNLPPVTCTQSPCVAAVDRRQDRHQVQLAYRDAAGAVLSRSDWQEVTVARAPQKSTYLASGGKTYSRYGEYLTFNLLNNEPSRKFLGKRVRYSVTGTGSVGKYTGFRNDAVHLYYLDSRAVYPHEIPEMRAIASARGFVFEDMLLHMSVDNVFYYALYKWQDMDRFDAFDTANGVLLYNGTAFTDRSTAAWDATTADVSFTASNTMLLAGYMEPFDQINIQVATPRQSGTVTLEYSGGQGVWSPLTVKSDSTNQLASSGRISFIPPANWRRASYNGSAYPKYWVRITVANASVWPVLSRVYGDDWGVHNGKASGTSSSNGLAFTATTAVASPYTHGTRIAWTPNVTCASAQPGIFATLNLNGLGAKKLYTRNSKTGFDDAPLTADSMGYDCNKDREIVVMYDTALDGGKGGFRLWNTNRGWCQTDTLGNDRVKALDASWEYDPTPGPSCSAKFRYQARLLFGWAPNNFAANISDIQRGERTRARYIVDCARRKFSTNGVTEYNGIFLDDLSVGQPSPEHFQHPVPRAQPIAYTELGPMTSQQEIDLMASEVRDVRALLRIDYPNFKVGVNSQPWKLTRESDLAFHEWGMYAYAGRGWRYTVNPDIYGGQTIDVLGRNGYGGEGSDRYSNEAGTGAHGEAVYSIHTYLDTASDFSFPNGCTSNCTGWWQWDRGNRGPLMALALYYMGASDFTSFFYCQSALATYYQSDEYQYWDETPDVTLTSELTQNLAQSNGATKTLRGNFSQFPSGATLVRIGQQAITITKTGSTTATTTNQIATAYPAGTGLHIIKTAKASLTPAPPAERVYRWNTYFPARDIDVGVPDTSATALTGDANISGIPRRGFRKLEWYQAGFGSGGGGLMNEISRRDFTKAIVVLSPGFGGGPEDYSRYSRVLNLNDATGKPITVYPLRADGRTGGFCGPDVVPAADGGCPGKIQLRTGEGLILMKTPVY